MPEQSYPYRNPPSWTDGTSPVVPRARLDVRLEIIGDEAVAYDTGSGNTIHLNQSALRVWQQCDGRTTTVEMALHQTEWFDIDAETALDHVEQLVTTFAEAGLLEEEAVS